MSAQSLGITYCLLLIALGLVGMAIEKRITRKRWPQGHGDSYFWNAQRKNPEDLN